METNHVVKIENLSVSYHGTEALQNISFSVLPKQLIGIIGPNGAGKSTLIKAIMGLIDKDEGDIKLFNDSMEKAYKKIAYVPQHNDIDLDFPVLVEDVVMMGRYPHLPWWGRPRTKDYQTVEACLKKVGMLSFRKKQIGALSGGQRQRVFLARALAQEAHLFFLDEPFAAIDVTSEKIIIDILRRLKEESKTIFVVHHDLSKAETYFDSLILLNKKLVKYGKSHEVFNIEKLQEAYEDNVAILSDKNKFVAVSG
ncbi:MAG: metal ABC transporter ATP-binding protein [Clostridiaceae bacterium]|nr:metal ABC transporter ATP-binding protein [Clostridiaceae bacterium]